MPKIVDHNQRRRELVEATWQVIARRGISGTTMREIAQEAGYANGALKPYFPTKSDLLEATYNHVFELTEARIDKAIQGLRGLALLRALCLEILPVSASLRDEARIVVSFWEAAARDSGRSQLAAKATDRWRDRILQALEEAGADGELRAGLNARNVAGVMLGFLMGSQVTAVMDPASFSPEHLRDHLEGHLDLLRG